MHVTEIQVGSRRVQVAHHPSESAADAQRRALAVLELAQGDAGALAALQRCLLSDATLHAGRAGGLAERNRSGVRVSESVVARVAAEQTKPAAAQIQPAQAAQTAEVRRRKGETQQQADARAAEVRDLAAEHISPLYSDEIRDAVLADVLDELSRSSILDAESIEQYVIGRLDVYRRVERMGPEPVDASLPGLSDIMAEGAE